MRNYKKCELQMKVSKCVALAEPMLAMHSIRYWHKKEKIFVILRLKIESQIFSFKKYVII
jgi:hypothetical protein